jgi:hypothetical protein
MAREFGVGVRLDGVETLRRGDEDDDEPSEGEGVETEFCSDDDGGDVEVDSAEGVDVEKVSPDGNDDSSEGVGVSIAGDKRTSFIGWRSEVEVSTKNPETGENFTVGIVCWSVKS